jgi:outer membrane protein assembly factor BamD (BamD/ComL family)
MFQNITAVVIAAVLVAAGTTACEKKKTAAELAAEKQKAFREKQKIEAIKAYTALTTKFPESEFAPKAQERLSVLGPLPAATPAKK